jgi:hypothetical protein
MTPSGYTVDKTFQTFRVVLEIWQYIVGVHCPVFVQAEQKDRVGLTSRGSLFSLISN